MLPNFQLRLCSLSACFVSGLEASALDLIRALGSSFDHASGDDADAFVQVLQTPPPKSVVVADESDINASHERPPATGRTYTRQAARLGLSVLTHPAHLLQHTPTISLSPYLILSLSLFFSFFGAYFSLSLSFSFFGAYLSLSLCLARAWENFIVVWSVFLTEQMLFAGATAASCEGSHRTHVCRKDQTDRPSDARLASPRVADRKQRASSPDSSGCQLGQGAPDSNINHLCGTQATCPPRPSCLKHEPKPLLPNKPLRTNSSRKSKFASSRRTPPGLPSRRAGTRPKKWPQTSSGHRYLLCIMQHIIMEHNCHAVFAGLSCRDPESTGLSRLAWSVQARTCGLPPVCRLDPTSFR